MTNVKAIHIYDFDGTLVDSSHRYRTITDPCGTERIDLPYWIENEHRALEDSLLPLAERFRQECHDPEILVIVATARIWCAATIAFVKREDLQPDFVVARRNRQDTRGGAELKIEGIREIVEHYDLEGVDEYHVFEDNVSYLETLCKAFKAVGHLYISRQGH